MIFEIAKTLTSYVSRTKKLRSCHSVKHDYLSERVCVEVVNKVLRQISKWFNVCEGYNMLSLDCAGHCAKR